MLFNPTERPITLNRVLAITLTTASIWTAIGTLAVAFVTGVSLYFGWRSLRQNQREIELSRKEVEEAHRPVIVPVVDDTSYMDLGGEGAGLERRPQLRSNGRLFVPVENIGAGPALNVEASVSGTSLPEEAAPDPQTAARVAGLRESGFIPLLIELPRWTELWTFTLTIEYDDIAGKGWATRCVFFRETGRYDGMTITAIERGRPLSDMVRPVEPA